MRTDRNVVVPSRGIRVLALIVAIAATLAVEVNPATGQTNSTKPAATEVGVTDTEIHIAVMADVDNPIAPNVFVGARDAVEGFAKFINSSCATKNTCLAGRKLVVDFYDSQLNPNQARNGQIQACNNDLAMVGTSAAPGEQHRRHAQLQRPRGHDDRSPRDPGHHRRDRPAVLRRVLSDVAAHDRMRHQRSAPPDVRRQCRPGLLLHEKVRRSPRRVRLQQRLADRARAPGRERHRRHPRRRRREQGSPFRCRHHHQWC